MTSLIATKNKVISCVSGESAEELEEAGEAFDRAYGAITKGSAEKLIVLACVLRELPKLNGRHKWIKFDFGGKKRFLLSRIK